MHNFLTKCTILLLFLFQNMQLFCSLFLKNAIFPWNIQFFSGWLMRHAVVLPQITFEMWKFQAALFGITIFIYCLILKNSISSLQHTQISHNLIKKYIKFSQLKPKLCNFFHEFTCAFFFLFWQIDEINDNFEAILQNPF